MRFVLHSNYSDSSDMVGTEQLVVVVGASGSQEASNSLFSNYQVSAAEEEEDGKNLNLPHKKGAEH